MLYIRKINIEIQNALPIILLLFKKHCYFINNKILYLYDKI